MPSEKGYQFMDYLSRTSSLENFIYFVNVDLQNEYSN